MNFILALIITIILGVISLSLYACVVVGKRAEKEFYEELNKGDSNE